MAELRFEDALAPTFNGSTEHLAHLHASVEVPGGGASTSTNVGRGYAHGVLGWCDVSFGDEEAVCVSSDPRNGGTPVSGYLTNVLFVDTPVQLTGGGARLDVHLEVGKRLRVSMGAACL